MGLDELLSGGEALGLAAIEWGPSCVKQWTRGIQMRGAVATGGNALPKDDPPKVTRCKSAAAKRVQAHRARARLGFRCLTVRVNDRIVRHLISTGYLSLQSSGAAPAVAFALEAWIYDNLP